MSLPYFSLYPSDFEAKTSHLTLLEDGVYNRLLRLCWMTPGCSIPADEAWIMRRLRARTDEEQEAVRSVLDEFFTVEPEGFSAPIIAQWLKWHRAVQPRPAIPLAVQRQVRERDGEMCQYCGCERGPFHLNHVYPYSLGGEHYADNLVVACAPCNWSKGSKTLDEWGGIQ